MHKHNQTRTLCGYILIFVKSIRTSQSFHLTEFEIIYLDFGITSERDERERISPFRQENRKKKKQCGKWERTIYPFSEQRRKEACGRIMYYVSLSTPIH